MPKISALTAATSVGPTDTLAIVQGGETKRATAAMVGIYDRTAAEIAASVTPTDYAYPPGDVRRYGAAADGVTDDTAAIETALAVAKVSGGAVSLGGAAYVVSTITIPAGSVGVRLVGDGATISTAQKIAVEFAGSASDFELRGLRISTSEVSAAGVYGLVTAENQNISDLRVIGCYFTAPNSATNGIKTVNTTAGTELRGLLVQGCTFEAIGQMGVECINHTYDGVPRFFDVRIIGNRFKGLGAAAAYGMAVSLSGDGRNCVIADNAIEDADAIAIEIIGPSGTTVSGNTLRNLKANCVGIYFAKPASAADKPQRNAAIGNVIEGNGSYALQITRQQSCAIEGNVITGTCRVLFEVCDYLSASGNSILITGDIVFIDCIGVSAAGARFSCLSNALGYNPTLTNVTLSAFSGCIFSSERATGLLLQGTSANNLLSGCIVSNEASAAAGAVLQFSGASVTGNVVLGCLLRRTAAGGPTWAQSSGAVGNLVMLPTANAVNTPAADYYATALTLATGANSHLNTVKLGSYHLWVDSTGDLRIHSAAPTANTDGVVVGTQS